MDKRVRKILNEVNEEICTYQGKHLLEDRVIDSFDVMEIVAGLEEEFEIEIDADYVIAENFANAESIIVLMNFLLGRGQL